MPAPASASAPQNAPHRSSDRKSTRLNSSHQIISYAVFCLKKKNTSLNYSHQLISYPVICLKRQNAHDLSITQAVFRTDTQDEPLSIRRHAHRHVAESSYPS